MKYLKLLCLGLVLTSQVAFSCPSFFFAYRIPFKNKFSYQRKNVSLFVRSDGKWEQRALQINKAYRNGVLDFSLKANSLVSKLSKFDRVSFNPSDLSKEVWQGKGQLPCGASSLVQVKSAKKFGYIAFCKHVQNPLSPSIVYTR